MDFTGKTAIITGAAKGIGRGCAEILARGGANVVLADINLGMAREAERALTEEGLRAKAVQVDVKSVAEIEKMVRAADEAFGTVDILVNNAGIFHATPIEEITEPVSYTHLPSAWKASAHRRSGSWKWFAWTTLPRTGPCPSCGSLRSGTSG